MALTVGGAPFIPPAIAPAAGPAPAPAAAPAAAPGAAAPGMAPDQANFNAPAAGGGGDKTAEAMDLFKQMTPKADPAAFSKVVGDMVAQGKSPADAAAIGNGIYQSLVQQVNNYFDKILEKGY